MILYNGATGGLGRYLAARLSECDVPSHAIAARLEDPLGLERELDSLRATDEVTVIHLAALVSVPACETDPDLAHRTNVVLARSTVETILSWASARRTAVRVIYVSTGHVYAVKPPGSRLTEDDPAEPRSVYARTKLAAEIELSGLCATYDVPFLAARVFGLLAPRQASNYVLPGLIGRVRRNELDGIPGLDLVRDYLDARDVSDDLLLLASVPWPAPSNVVNLCSGTPITIRELLKAVLEVRDPSRAEAVAMAARAAPGRPDEVTWMVGDPSRFIALTGAPPRRLALSVTVADAVAALDP